jgi:DNA-directed RNA polymerase beta subunit
MLSSHVSQAVQPAQSDIPRVMTGLEQQLGDFTFNVKMPTNGIVESVHRKFHYDVSIGRPVHNPVTTIIYQCQETGLYDFIDVYEYHTRHKTFGCRFIINPMVERLRPGMPIAKGTILAHSPSIKEGGIYATGIETNVAFMSLPGCIEDGFVVSESFCRRAAPLEMTSSIVEWGRKAYPLNIYGDEHNYKPFPDVGDKIRDDGLVFALREYDTQFDAVEMTPKSLMEVDMIHDIRVYGIAGAEVYDVIVESGIGESRSKVMTPKGMEVQASRYILQTSDYYQGIKETYDRLVKQHPNRLNISPQLQNLITRSIADKPNSVRNINSGNTSGIIRRVYKNNPLDEYRVEVKYFNRKTFHLGSKITGRHGNKGVVCQILPDDHMPVDMAGNRADVVTFAKAAVARLNPGQFYEHYINAASRDMTKWVREKVNILSHEEIWKGIMDYYEAASPEQHSLVLKNYPSVIDQKQHIQSIVDSGIYLYISPDSPHIGPEMYKRVQAVINPVYGPVTYIDPAGQRVTTRDPVFIGIMDMIVLEKTEQRPMAVSSATLQHHGLISGNNKEIRNAHPSKQQSTRVLGETELRLIAAVLGGDIAAEMLDLANSPESHRAAVMSILASDQPVNVPRLVNRDELPLGRSRVLSFFNHVLLCTGCAVVDD